MDLVEMVYQATALFPKEETYGLAAQARRCAVSVPANIAEGACRNSSRELFQFLGIANRLALRTGNRAGVGHTAQLLAQE